jgi:hypothetical protein
VRARVVRARVPATAQLEAGHGGLANNLTQHKHVLDLEQLFGIIA